MSQTVVDLSDFEDGTLGPWQFKSWMPAGRKADVKVVALDGFRSKHCLQLEADGRDDDGIFFIQRTLKADIEGPFHTAYLSWWMKGAALRGATSWPRVVYFGPPKDLTKQDTQKAFHWFTYDEGLQTCADCAGWYAHFYKQDFPDGLDELQICVGWKINWETGRTLLMDEVLLVAS